VLVSNLLVSLSLSLYTKKGRSFRSPVPNTQGECLEAIAIGQDLGAPGSCKLVIFEAGVEIGHPERIPGITNPYGMQISARIR